MHPEIYAVPDGYYTTKQAAHIIGRTSSAVRYNLRKPDKYILVRRGKLALWDSKRVDILAEKIIAAQNKGLSRLPPVTTDRHSREYDKYSKPLDAPTYRGRMCPFCKKVEVPTGTYCCTACSIKRGRHTVSILDDNSIYG